MNTIFIWIGLCQLLLMASGILAVVKPTYDFNKANKPGITRLFYGNAQGHDVYEYTLTNSSGMRLK